MIYKAIIRKTKIFIGGTDFYGKPRKIDCLMISHKFDDDCLYITIPEIFDTPELEEDFLFLIDEIGKLLIQNASNVS